MRKCHCGKHASFNTPGDKTPMFCKYHKILGMVNVKNKNLCKEDGCKKQPMFNLLGESKGLYCAIHKNPEMVDIINITCKSDGCRKGPVFNVLGESKGLYCAIHKDPEMVNVKNMTCKYDGCRKGPSFNSLGESKGLYCSVHKHPEMVDVKHITCNYDGCRKIPAFNRLGESKGLYCVSHKDPEMVNVNEMTCNHDGCRKIPSFNAIGESKGLYCASHKKTEMVNVKEITCNHDGCRKIPSFNTIGKSKGLYCVSHKKTEMVNVHKTCEFKDCGTQPSYGWLGKSLTYCGTHRLKGMIKSTKRQCSTTYCKSLGTHEYNGERYCDEHKPDNATNLGLDTCSSCGLEDILTNGTCNTCDPTTVMIRRHVKENRVKDVLTANKFKFIHDKILESVACGRERPDFQIDCGDFYIYLEVDENQHESYACECEQTRMINLVHARGMPVMFIRYNPDVYEPVPGQRRIKLEQREKQLMAYLKHYMKNPPMSQGAFANVLYLFYDGHDSHNPSLHTLLEL